MEEKCAKCKGGCCKGLSVEVYGIDDVPSDLLVVRNKAFYMRKQKDHVTCIAFIDNKCSIYDNRPRVCREFLLDNPRCILLQKRRINGKDW